MEPQNQINEVKSRTDIVSLVSNYVTLKKAGRNYKGVCPFHTEKTPSFMVSPDRQIYKCFGCGEGGDVLTFYEKIEGVEFAEALSALANKAGVILKELKPSRTSQQKEIFSEILKKTAEFYHFLLTKHPSGKLALDYLKARGVNEKSIADFQLGFAPDSWDTTNKFLLKKKFHQKDLIGSGVVIASPKGAYDRFRRRIVFPIFSTSGDVVGFSGRIFGGGEPKYLNSPDSLIFNKSNILYGLNLAKTEIKKEDSSVLVEGNLDVISSYQAGVKNVVCPLGTALTESQLLQLRRFSDNLILCFDADPAGVQAAKRAIVLSETAGLNIKVAEIPAKDPDELIKKSPNAWRSALKAAVSGYEFIFNQTIASFPLLDQAAIRKITAELVPPLRKIENEITRSHYERLLAAKLEVDVDSIKKEVAKGSNLSEASVAVNQTSNQKSDPLSLEKYLLGLIIQSETFPAEVETLEVRNDKIRTILQIINKQQKNAKFTLKEIGQIIPAELTELFNEVALKDIPEILIDQEKMVEEIKTCALRLKELNLRTRLKEAGLAIRQAEMHKENQKIEDLSKLFKNLSEQLSEVEKKRQK